MNAFDVPLEATYIFPLPDRAAVTGFRMEVAGRVIEGVLQERAEAREAYEQAIAEGQRAAIAEEDRPGVFNLRVGNLMPGDRAAVELTMCGVLPYAGGEVTFRFPLVVAPRYIPGTPLPGPSAGDGTALDTIAVPDASRISPPVLLPGFASPVRLSLVVLITDGQVGNEDQILSTLGRRLKGIRVFTLGIDRAVNEGFLRRLAERGGGTCELVESEARLDEVMQAIHRRIATPLLTGLYLESKGMAIEPGEVVPSRLPDLFCGSPLLILGRYRGLRSLAHDSRD